MLAFYHKCNAYMLESHYVCCGYGLLMLEYHSACQVKARLVHQLWFKLHLMWRFQVKLKIEEKDGEKTDCHTCGIYTPPEISQLVTEAWIPPILS